MIPLNMVNSLIGIFPGSKVGSVASSRFLTAACFAGFRACTPRLPPFVDEPPTPGMAQLSAGECLI
jgi:hypothetical protein